MVAWLNADDLYRPGALRFVADTFGAQADLDVLVGDCDMIDEQDRVLRRLSPRPYDFKRLLRYGNDIAQPAVFIRHPALKAVGYIDESLNFGMDYDLWLRLRHHHITRTSRVLAAFRWHPSSKTASNQAGNWHELLRIVRRYGGGWTMPLVVAYVRARASAWRTARRIQS